MPRLERVKGVTYPLFRASLPAISDGDVADTRD